MQNQENLSGLVKANDYNKQKPKENTKNQKIKCDLRFRNCIVEILSDCKIKGSLKLLVAVMYSKTV